METLYIIEVVGIPCWMVDGDARQEAGTIDAQKREHLPCSGDAGLDIAHEPGMCVNVLALLCCAGLLLRECKQRGSV